MLKRRVFLKLSGLLAGGAVITLATPLMAMDAGDASPKSVVISERGKPPPIYRYHGHARSGCSFRPELSDLWAGGGAQLPDLL